MAIVKKKPTTEAKPKVTRAKKAVEPPAPPPYVSPFEVGSRVTHVSFGNGKVSEVSSDKLSILFDDNTSKIIVDSFVKPLKG